MVELCCLPLAHKVKKLLDLISPYKKRRRPPWRREDLLSSSSFSSFFSCSSSFPIAAMSRTRPDWTSLPQHILTSIAKLLYTRIDMLRFRAVCSAFRSALPAPPKFIFPQSLLKSSDFLKGPNPKEDHRFILSESTVYAIQPLDKVSGTPDESFQTWLIKVGVSRPGIVEIMDPLSGSRSKKLPKPLNLLDYRVTEISKSYVFQSAIQSRYHTQVIFPPSLSETDEEFSLMAKHDDSERKLGLWRNMDMKWSSIDIGLKFPEFFEDITYHNDKFYALVSSSRVITVDSKSLAVTEVAAALHLNREFSLLYLVKSLKDLFMVVKYEEYNGEEDYFIHVYKLDEERCMWVPVVDGAELQDRGLFVGHGFTYSVSAKEFSGCKGNAVYFTIDTLGDKCDHPGRDTTWIFDFQDHLVGPISEFPGYSEMFWPPPAPLN